MKTEEQIKKKYKEMLEHTKLLTDKYQNPNNHDDVNVHNIQEHIRNANEQFSMNSLIEWVLDIKK
jgi:hypothetical protein